MIKVRFINSPTNYNDPYIRAFSSLEDAVRTIVNNSKTYAVPQLISVEEDGVGFHRAFLTSSGSVNVSDWSCPSGGELHESEAYKEMTVKIYEEFNKPKLA